MVIRSLPLLLALITNSVATEIPRAEPADVGLSEERLHRITRAIEEDVEKGYLAGAIGVVARRGKIAYWKTVGMADREASKRMRDDTIFRIYSMTKPIVGVALMTLYEEGKFALNDPVKKHLPELGGLNVLEGNKEVPADREMTVQDLMRHTSGMTYGLFGDSRVDEMYMDANLLGGNQSIEHFVRKLSKLPLKHQPGSAWEYSVSVDVQGRLIEVLSGMDLDEFMSERVFKPLDMRDTSFRMTAESKGRFVRIYRQTEDKKGIEPAPASRSERYFDTDTRWYSGGGGLVSTTRDYLRFCQMMLNGGVLDGKRVLSRKTVDLMTIDHIADVPRASSISRPGYGFGLDFAVHLDPAKSGLNGSVGEYNWGGLAGTIFWIDPAEEMIGLYMIQALPPRFEDSRTQFKRLAYQAIVD
jgi:CubicO group peptidase (beta-lactamase class C family)